MKISEKRGVWREGGRKPCDATESSAITDEGTSCSATREFFCTRAANHKGDHVAGGGETIYERWPQERSRK